MMSEITQVVNNMLLELHSPRFFAIWLEILFIKYLQLLVCDWEEHCVVHSLNMILDIPSRQQKCSIPNEIDE